MTHLNNVIIFTISGIGLFIVYNYYKKPRIKYNANESFDHPPPMPIEPFDKISNGFNGIFGNNTLNISKILNISKVKIPIDNIFSQQSEFS